jgi:hypothetical protein
MRRSGVIEIRGGHEELASGLVDALASLKEGDEFLAVSTLNFWNPGNIGVRGRFFSMTHLCAQRGVKIRRLFLLKKADQREDYFWQIMKAQVELQKANENLGNGCLQTRFRLLSDKDFLYRIENGDHCGYWISGEEVMSMDPVYDAQKVLRSIRLIVTKEAPQIVRSNFEKDFSFKNGAEPLTLTALRNSMKSQPEGGDI